MHGYICLSPNRLCIMIQRVQSLYLILSIILLVGSYFVPFGTVALDSSEWAIRSYGLRNADGVYASEPGSYWFHIPLTAIILANTYSLFNYSNRKRQLRVLRFTFLLFAASFVLLSLYIFQIGSVYPDGVVSPGASLLILFGALASNWFATRSIKKDEELVRSVDRIR